MQKVFEKIIEKLEEKARFYNSASDIDQNVRSGVIIAKEVVQEEAAEYNNGWIPCHEREPEKDKTYEVTFKKWTKYGYVYETGTADYKYGDWFMHDDIIAWKEKTAPYVPQKELYNAKDASITMEEMEREG